MNTHGWIVPDWPAPPNVRALITTRAGGVSFTAPENYALARAISIGSQPSSKSHFSRAIG